MVYIYQSVHLQSEPTVKHCFSFFLFLVAVFTLKEVYNITETIRLGKKQGGGGVSLA